MEDSGGHADSLVSRADVLLAAGQRALQRGLDRVAPHTAARWTATALLLLLAALRVVAYGGFFVVAYALAVYLLNVTLLFLSPRFDPSGELFGLGDGAGEGAAGDGPIGGGVDEAGEYRPFVRRLPELRAWYNATRATAVALFCMLFPALDIPAFWPILAGYFVLLTFVTMRRQVAHMVKHGYVPFDLGKRTYSQTRI